MIKHLVFIFVYFILFFRSYSGYQDELAWAAVWLYKATGEATYLNYAKTIYSGNGFSGNRYIQGNPINVITI